MVSLRRQQQQKMTFSSEHEFFPFHFPDLGPLGRWPWQCFCSRHCWILTGMLLLLIIRCGLNDFLIIQGRRNIIIIIIEADCIHLPRWSPKNSDSNKFLIIILLHTLSVPCYLQEPIIFVSIHGQHHISWPPQTNGTPSWLHIVMKIIPISDPLICPTLKHRNSRNGQSTGRDNVAGWEKKYYIGTCRLSGCQRAWWHGGLAAYLLAGDDTRAQMNEHQEFHLERISKK